MPHGTFVISLDFELHWGIRDKFALPDCKDRMLRTRRVIPKILALLTKYQAEATWATVGLLFADGREQALEAMPTTLPRYQRAHLSPYAELERTGLSEEDDPFHFAPSLIEEVASTSGQEIGTHTFSHFYCCERGVDAEAFRADLVASKRIAENSGYQNTCASLVFPRNQYNAMAIGVARELGIRAYRPNKNHWAYTPCADEKETKLRRAVRLGDAFVPLTGRDAFAPPSDGAPLPIYASRFLRPYSKKTGGSLGRITSGLRDAARSHRIFHLWWHPHNFGRDEEANLERLEHVLDAHQDLRRSHGMKSLSMGNLSKILARGNRH